MRRHPAASDGVHTLSALSGLAWGAIAVGIGHRPFGYSLMGGVLAAPFIGLLIGQLSRPLRGSRRFAQILGSLVDLYLAAACLAVAMAVFSIAAGLQYGSWRATVVQLVFAVLWGLTFGGYVVMLWPLSYFNHRLVWQAASGEPLAAPRVVTTTEAVRRLAAGVMAFAVIGYVVWAMFRLSQEGLGSSTTSMPWWVVTGLMGWSRWFLLGWFTWLAAPLLAIGASHAAGSRGPSATTYRELVAIAGFVLIVLPPLNFIAGLTVVLIKVALLQSWAMEGAALWRAYAGHRVLLTYLPWLSIGGALVASCRLLAAIAGRSRRS